MLHASLCQTWLPPSPPIWASPPILQRPFSETQGEASEKASLVPVTESLGPWEGLGVTEAERMVEISLTRPLGWSLRPSQRPWRHLLTLLAPGRTCQCQCRRQTGHSSQSWWLKKGTRELLSPPGREGPITWSMEACAGLSARDPPLGAVQGISAWEGWPHGMVPRPALC